MARAREERRRFYICELPYFSEALPLEPALSAGRTLRPSRSHLPYLEKGEVATAKFHLRSDHSTVSVDYNLTSAFGSVYITDADTNLEKIECPTGATTNSQYPLQTRAQRFFFFGTHGVADGLVVLRFKTAPSEDLRRILGQQPFLALGAQWHCNVSATIQGGSATQLLYAKATRTRFQPLSAELTVQPAGLFDVIQGWASVEVQPPADDASRQRKPKARKPDSLDATILNATGLRSKAHTLAVTTGS
jgi:hypothetical protein